MPSLVRACALPVSWTSTRKPLACMCAIQSLQQPQVGLFQTSTSGAGAAGCAAAQPGTPRASTPSSSARRRPMRFGAITLLSCARHPPGPEAAEPFALLRLQHLLALLCRVERVLELLLAQLGHALVRSEDRGPVALAAGPGRIAQLRHLVVHRAHRRPALLAQ